ncbi:hypothetical protein NUW54_g13948 [Trametes sanguinea]|uniref:Uncharacterized protein n=1 Tax=Trametes sanguinea TaxID=158606 RepID=A0ACC1MH25_9APHY|nr:hypothetical protein NUW54_g13948 [Trametes sanguinea]
MAQCPLIVESDISWKPIYELRTHTSSDGSLSANVSLGYNAIVSQRTGEDWSNGYSAHASQSHRDGEASRMAILASPRIRYHRHSNRLTAPLLAFTDSTHPSAPANRDPAVPIAPALFVRFPQHAATNSEEAPRESSSSVRREDRHLSGSTRRPGAERPMLPSRTAEEASTPLHDEVDSVRPSDTELPPPLPLLPPPTGWHGMFGSTIHLPTPISLPGNGEAHKFTIAALGLEGRCRYFCVPRESLDVQVLAEFKNRSEYDLLPGPVNVLVNDELAFKSEIGVRTSLITWLFAVH